MSKNLEIGPGRGDFLFFLAEQEPGSQVVGVEYKRKRFDKLVARREKRGLANVELVLGDARRVLPERFPDGEFDRVFVLFSDPWPKKRHAKHRLFQVPFASEILRVLKPEGRVFIAHDDPKYVAQIKAVFRDLAPFFVAREEGIAFPTFYADKWRKEGRLIWSFSYEKTMVSNRPALPAIANRGPGGCPEGSPAKIGGPCVHIPFEEPRDLPESAAGPGL